MALRGACPRQHARLVRRSPAQGAAGSGIASHDRHRPRSWLPLRPVILRLTMIVVLAVALGLLALSAGALLVLDIRLDAAADEALSGRADAVVATLAPANGTVTMLDTPADDVLDAGVWVFDSAGRIVVRAPGSATVEKAVA